MYFAELLVRDVGVELRGGNACVSEHGLDAADVRAVAEQVGGKTVPEHMRGYFFSHAGEHGVLMDEALH